MSGLREEMRPYLVVWPVVVRLCGGTWRLVCRLATVCMAGEGAEKLWRALGAVAVATVAGRIVVRAPLVELPLLAVWAVLAWRAGPAPKEEPDERQEEQHGDEEQPGEETEERPLPGREQLVAALHAVADPHAHLSALAAHLQETAARVREGLKEAGIPVAGGVRAGGRVSTGVKKDHFPPLLPAPSDSPGGVVVAGQPDNNNADARRPYLSREGFWTTPDPQRPSGWNVAQRT